MNAIAHPSCAGQRRQPTSRTLASLGSLLTVPATLLAKLPAVSAPSGATLVWSDEFDYEGLPDPARWSYDVGGGGWGNNELQY